MNTKNKKIVFCFFCKYPFVIDRRASNEYSVCKVCKVKGKKNPKAQQTGSLTSASIMRKYGVSSAMHVPEFKEKQLENCRKATKEKKEEIVRRRKETNLKRRGVDVPSKDPIVIEKMRQTFIRNYGVDHPLKLNRIKEKSKDTYKERTGFEYSFQNPEVREKGKLTSINKYGVDHWTKSPEGKEKLRNKYEEKQKPYFIRALRGFLESEELELLDEYKHAHYHHLWKCTKCKNTFRTCWNNIQQGYKCPVCFKRDGGTSLAEGEIYNFIKGIIGSETEILLNTRRVIYPLELDLYIPEKRLAIEYNGLFWHSIGEEKNKDNKIDENYHLLKLKECINKDIRLIQIFEDEWLFKKDIVKSRLRQILGDKGLSRIYARKCHVREIKNSDKDLFLLENHIQGTDISKIRIGAFYDEELVSVMTFSKGNISKGNKNADGIWELNRFCSKNNYIVVGIASKLLSYFKKNYEWKELYSYADRRWSVGNLYYQLGFQLDKETGCNYWYVKGYKRIHRFNLRKTNDEQSDKISEKLLRLSQGYRIIWDCGNLKFLLTKKDPTKEEILELI